MADIPIQLVIGIICLSISALLTKYYEKNKKCSKKVYVIGFILCYISISLGLINILLYLLNLSTGIVYPLSNVLLFFLCIIITFFLLLYSLIVMIVQKNC
jgi:heme/copper-type cytochrome/quinol oxidase subunit 1